MTAASAMPAAAQTATAGGKWTQQTPANNPFGCIPGTGVSSGRSQPAMAYDAMHGVVVLFGGLDTCGNPLNDTWVWDGTNWTQKFPATSPSGRYDPGMAYDAATGSTVLFGGTDINGAGLNDTWVWDGNNWTQQSPATSPSGRYLSAMTYDAATGTVVLFGGFDSAALNDTWMWDGTNWTQASPANQPPARYAHVLAYDGATGTVVLFSGNLYGNLFDDTWTWDGTNWTQQNPATSPAGRIYATMAYDGATGGVVLYGGATSTSSAVGAADVWSWNGTTWAEISASAAPGARFAHAMAYDAGTQSLVVFSGRTSGGTPNDTWTYVGGSFEAPTTAVGSTASAQTPVYFTITGDGTLPALSNTNVLLGGASGKDFTLGTGSDCTGAVTAGMTCTVNVAFAPSAPGLRQGAVKLVDASNNLLATALVSGYGYGPQATVTPGVLTNFAGTAAGACGSSTATCGDGGPAGSAMLNELGGVAVDGAGNLYIADSADHRIRKVDATTGTITTVAGSGNQCSDPTQACGDGALATDPSVDLNYPSGVAVDGAGNLYIMDSSDNRVRMVNATTGIISTLAGTGTTCISATVACGDGGPATAAFFNYPVAGVVDGTGNLYVADTFDSRIRVINLNTGTVSAFAGSGNYCGTSTDPCGDGGPANQATFGVPLGLALDAAGDVYVTDGGINRVRKISAATGTMTSVAGSGTMCSGASTCGDNGSALAAGADLDAPAGLAIDSAGNLYIAEGDALNPNEQRVRKVSTAGSIAFPTVTPAGTPDTTDGTLTATLNNIGNSTLNIASMTNNNANFQAGNPLSGGCSTDLTAGDSCLLGEQFSPAAGSPALVVGSLGVTDNSLNAASAVQFVPLSGNTTAGGLLVAVGQASAVAGTTSVTLAASVGYGGSSLPAGAVTFTVNGSSTGVGTVACKAKASHLNCTASYDMSSLVAGNYTISAAVAADSNYSAASGTSTLYVTGSSSGVHVSPVTMVVGAPAAVANARRVVATPLPSPAVTIAPVVVLPDAAPADGEDSSCSSGDGTNCAGAEKAVPEPK